MSLAVLIVAASVFFVVFGAYFQKARESVYDDAVEQAKYLEDRAKQIAEEELEKGHLIVYTSADSVLQICGNEETMGLETLYKYCEIARELTMKDEWKVGRVIARPFTAAIPIRSPVKEPGPQFTAKRSTSAGVILAASRTALAIGRTVSLWVKPLSR